MKIKSKAKSLKLKKVSLQKTLLNLLQRQEQIQEWP